MMPEFLISQSGFFSSLFLFATGAIISLVFHKSDRLANFFGSLFAVLGSFFGFIFSLNALLSGKIISLVIPTSFPLISLSFYVDQLSAFLILIVSFVALFCSIYGFGYSKHFYKKYDLGYLGFFFNIFIASVILVVSAHNAIFFLFAWEVMSLSSYFLVIYEHKENKNVEAGSLYFIMTHTATAFITFSFLLIYKQIGTFDFGAYNSGLAGVSPFVLNAIFISALIGFGTKAGMIPLHIWLPSAHPAAPSHVSAMMSGVMIKTGIYMLVRFCFEFLPMAPVWWGTLILVLGAVSSVLGVLYALVEHDIKRLLAYHSIENIGIILLGLGSSLVFLSLGMKDLAMIGLIASLFHTMNHAIFKALLFLGAGSVITGTHTRNIEEYGGLIKKMPQTAFFFLIGSMAISALPPFNGFFSEWMTFQSLFEGAISTAPYIKAIFIFSAGALALTGGLAAACFVKAFGVTFLARPRSEEAEHAKESPFSFSLGMSMLALASLLLGIFSGPVVFGLEKVAASMANMAHGSVSVISAGVGFVKIQDGFSVVSAPAIFFGILSALLFSFVLVASVSRGQKVSRNITWDCGADLTPRMEITATGFSRSFVTIFKTILRPMDHIKTDFADHGSKYFPTLISVHLETRDIYKKYFYDPIRELFAKISDEVKKIQSGNISEYVLYIFLTLLALLIALIV